MFGRSFFVLARSDETCHRRLTNLFGSKKPSSLVARIATEKRNSCDVHVRPRTHSRTLRITYAKGTGTLLRRHKRVDVFGHSVRTFRERAGTVYKRALAGGGVADARAPRLRPETSPPPRIAIKLRPKRFKTVRPSRMRNTTVSILLRFAVDKTIRPQTIL